ncbi:MAG TPA: HAD-IIB family hydrolase [Pirellulaceae bacterium]|nr:HAD-IIB family hydrolase [Pirellulaceae bacterium]
MSQVLVVSDLDGTLLGQAEALQRFAHWHAERSEQVLLAYSSGRSCASVVESIRKNDLPEPVAIIGGVGTEIERYPGGGVVRGWPSAGPPAWSAQRVREALANIGRLELQDEEFQSTYKVSYFLHDALPHELPEIRACLSGFGLACDLVYSSQRDLDLLPSGVNKGTAARYLAKALHVPASRLIVCGDSGNDASMFQQGFRGVIVANALPELRSRQGDDIYHASQAFAAGVVEGLDHWLGTIS